MSSGGGGGNTTTQSNQPPAQFLQAYQDVLNQAKGVAATPFQAYQGNVVAPFSPDQSAAFTGIENAQGIAAPFINTAAGYLNDATAPLLPTAQPYIDQARGIYGGAGAPLNVTPFSPEGVRQYESPYTDDVVNATSRLFNEQNQQQSNNLRGNAISAGAFGGDREGVAQGVLAGQQNLAQAPVLAGLRDKGYTQALGEFNNQQGIGLQADQAARQLGLAGAQGIAGLGSTALGAEQANRWLSSQAGYGFAGLGNQAQNSTLTGLNALLGIGGLQQQQAQAELNVPYGDYRAALGYPFQTTSWLSGIAQGTGSGAGGTSSSTSPGPSIGSQVLGAGVAGAGLLGQSGAFGRNGWLTGSSGPVADMSSSSFNSAADAAGLLPLGEARGGTVPHRASGGIVSYDIPDVSLSVIPSMQGSGRSPLILGNYGSTTTGEGPDTSGQDAAKAIGTIASIAALAFSDRRLKEDISRIGTLNDGTPVHRFRYKGDPQWQIGVIAQEVERRHPSAVHEMHGIKMVDTKEATDAAVRRRTGGGIMASNDNATNDNYYRPHGIALAAGGSAPIDVVMDTGHYAGSRGIPQLLTAPLNFGSTDAGEAPADAGALANATKSSNQAVHAYLTDVLRGASFAKPQTYQPPPPPAPGANIAGFPDLLSVLAAFGGASEHDGGGMSGQSGMDAAQAAAGGMGVGASHDVGQTELAAGASGGFGGLDFGGSSDLGGLYARGGRIRRAPGGGIDVDVSGGDTDWHDDAPVLASSVPDMPDVGRGIDIGGAPYGTSLPEVVATGRRPSPSATPEAEEVAESASVDTTKVPTYAGAPDDASNASAGKDGGLSPLLYAGLGILGGSSPHAGVNIGRGALAGLKEYETQENRRALVENNALYRKALLGDRRDARQNTKDYRDVRLGQIDRQIDQRQAIADRAAELRAQGMTDKRATAQARLDILQWNSANASRRADTAARAVDVRQAIADRSAELRAQGMDASQANARARLDVQQQGANDRRTQGQQRIGQGQQRVDQGQEKIDNTQDYRDRVIELRKNGMDATKAARQATIDMQQKRLDADTEYRGERLGQADRGMDLRVKALNQSKEANDARLALQRQGHSERTADAMVSDATKLVASGMGKMKDLPQIIEQLSKQRKAIAPPAAAPAAGAKLRAPTAEEAALTRRALAEKKDPAEVAQKLREHGIDPSGF